MNESWLIEYDHNGVNEEYKYRYELDCNRL